jgi:hypothetical protein
VKRVASAVGSESTSVGFRVMVKRVYSKDD